MKPPPFAPKNADISLIVCLLVMLDLSPYFSNYIIMTSFMNYLNNMDGSILYYKYVTNTSQETSISVGAGRTGYPKGGT